MEAADTIGFNVNPPVPTLLPESIAGLEVMLKHFGSIVAVLLRPLTLDVAVFSEMAG